MSKESIIRRRTGDKELRLAEGYVRTREAYEAAGTVFLGSVRAAAEQGYFTPAACARKQLPVTDHEWANIAHFAMLTDCYADQCIVGQTGEKRRPCLPVFFREEATVL